MQSDYPTSKDLYEAAENGQIQPFFDISNNHVTVAQSVLEECLRIAARSSKIVIVKHLINDHSVDKNAADDSGKTASNYAAGNSDIVEYLNYDSVLSQEFLNAVDDNNLEKVKSLLANDKVDVNAYNSSGDAFFRCCEKNLPEILKELLAHPKANPNGSPCSWSPLKTAISGSFQECIDLLLACPKIEKKIDNYGLGDVIIPEGVILEKSD